MLKLLLFINIFFNCHGNQFSVYIFITAPNQYVTIYRRCLFNDNSLLSVIFQCACRPVMLLFLPLQNMIRLKRRTRYAARQQRLSRGTLSCRALMDMRLAALSEQHARFQAFLGGTLPLPLITQRYIAGQNTSCKYRRFESASAESHEIRRMV